MVKLSMLMAGLAASATMAGVVEKRNERRCATRDLTPEEKDLRKRQMGEGFSGRNDIDDGDQGGGNQGGGNQGGTIQGGTQGGANVTLGVVFHNCCSSPKECPSVTRP